MANGDFLAKIRLALEGKAQVVSGLKETKQAAQQLASTKITTVYDKEGLATGKQITETFKKTGEAATKSGIGINDFRKALARVVVVAPIWMAARSAMLAVFNLVQSQIKYVLDLEDAMARIQIVGKGTAEEYNNLKYALTGLSIAYGISSSEALKAAVVFAQQGKTVAETFTLTRAAMIGAAVLGEDVVTTVESLTAAMNAFQIPTTEAMTIIDKLINVEKEYAVTSKDLAEGIKRVGATANLVGVSLSALTGDLAAVIEVTRKSGSEAAQGLSFIYARLLTTGKPVIQQLTGINFYLDEQGRTTNALTGTLRSASDILDELGSKWENLTNEEKLNIAAALGSKRQMVTLNALMQNYSTSLDARVTALTSAGSAEKALAILMDTTKYKTQQLGAAMNALTLTIADTSAWKEMLDNLKMCLLFYTKLINFEKGYRMELAAESTAQLANIETKQNQISSIEELIKMRDKLLTAPATDKTTERLEKINAAIEATAKSNPELEIAIKSGDPKEIDRVKKGISDKLLAEKITVQVGVDFIPKIAALEKRKGELQAALGEMAPVMKGIWGKKEMNELAGIDKKRAELVKEQTAEAQKQLSLAKAASIFKDIADEEETAQIRGQLTEKERESLEIERQINNYTHLSNATLTEKITKEIELVKASQAVYDMHAKTVKLAQLENQLIDAKLQKRDEELSRLGTLAMQYEKADMFEKGRIRRAAELALMSKEQIALAYQGSSFDKQIITDFWGSFSTEAKKAIQESTEFFKEFQNQITPTANLGVTNQQLVKAAIPAPIANITNFGAQNINVNVDAGGMATAEEVTALINKTIDEKLMTDESFINTFAKRISPKI
jgi:TP901 family phage tail tape measure protein